MYLVQRTGRFQKREKHSGADNELDNNLEKYIQQQMLILQNYIDVKKAFKQVWHGGLWKVREWSKC